nr:hypothetical protein [Tanacetum cinerariifolium]
MLDGGSDVLKGGIWVKDKPWEMTYGNGFELLGGIPFKEDRVWVVWMEVGVGIVRVMVVSRVVVKVVLMMLIGFWVEELTLKAMEYDDQGMRYEEEPSEKHSVGKCHIGTLGHTYHSVGDVVGKVEVFSNGEDDFLFFEIDFQLGNTHLKRVKEDLSFMSGEASGTVIHRDVVSGIMMIKVDGFWHSAPKENQS